MPVPPPVTPGPSSYVPSRLYPDFWNNLRPDHVPMHGAGHFAPTYDYPGPVPGPFAPVYACVAPAPMPAPPAVPGSGKVRNAPPKINRQGRVLVRKASTVPFKEPKVVQVAPPPPPAPMPACPRPCPCPCPPPSPGGFNPPEQATSKVYRNTVTLLDAGDNITLEETRIMGQIKYTVSSKDVETQTIVTQNTQKIEEIEEKLPELEVGSLTNDDIDDIFDTV